MKGLEANNSNFITILVLMIYAGLMPNDILKSKVEYINRKNVMIKYCSIKFKRSFKNSTLW